jgi:hypothetical protein
MENVVGRVCGVYGGEEKYMHVFWWGNVKETRGLGLDVRIILQRTLQK